MRVGERVHSSRAKPDERRVRNIIPNFPTIATDAGRPFLLFPGNKHIRASSPCCDRFLSLPPACLQSVPRSGRKNFALLSCRRVISN